MTSMYQIGVLQGDGIGPEITTATLAVFETAAQDPATPDLAWVDLPVGLRAIQTHGNPLPPETIERLNSCHGWILGPHDSVSYPDEFKTSLNPSARIRKDHDLYANIRPARTYAAVSSLVPQMDLVIVRENSEGLYADRNMFQGAGEFMPTPDVALATGVFTRRAAERIAHVACRLARSRRGKLTIVHKSNVLRLTTGLFTDTCRSVAQQYPELEVEDYHIDAMAAYLVRRPADFDVIVTTNMFGDILSDLTAELAGSLGLGASINAGDNSAMAQAVHGAAPDIAGRGIANPAGLIQSSVMLLSWMGDRYADPALNALATRVEDALATVLNTSSITTLTPDLGGNASTDEFAQALIQSLPAAVA